MTQLVTDVEAYLIKTILDQSGLGLNEIVRKGDYSKETLRKHISSLNEKGIIVDKGKKKHGTQSKWEVIDELHAKQVLAGYLRRRALTQTEENETIKVPITLSKILTQLPQSKEITYKMESEIEKLSASNPFIWYEIYRDTNSYIPNENIGKEFTEDLFNFAIISPLIQLVQRTPNLLDNEKEIAKLKKLKYDFFIHVDYTYIEKMIDPIIDFIRLYRDNPSLFTEKPQKNKWGSLFRKYVKR